MRSKWILALSVALLATTAAALSHGQDGEPAASVVRVRTSGAPLKRLPELAAQRTSEAAAGLSAAQADSPLARRAEAIGGKPCKDGSGALCGTFKVPLDWSRANGNGSKVGIAWKLYLHTAPGPAVSVITGNNGGPGNATVTHSYLWSYLLGSLFETHDVLLFDDRGRGESDAINCRALQHGTDTFANAAAACAAQLGPAIAFYSTASIARDTEALRSALGIDSFDFVGISYGTMDALAYASRYPTRMHSIVIDSGFGLTPFDLPTNLRAQAAAIRRGLALVCGSQPWCHAAIPDPLAQLAWGAEYLRTHPVEGDAPDPLGVTRHVRLTEALLAGIAGLPSNSSVTLGELPAALVALRAGDVLPILRIAAARSDSWGPGVDYGDPAFFSAGAFFATECADDRTPPWRQGRSYSGRLADALAVMRAMPAADLAPWTADELIADPATGAADWDNQIGSCVRWPDTPGVEGSVVDPRTLPDVPVLGLVGNLDLNVPLDATLQDLALFPHHQTINVGLYEHDAAFTSKCGRDRVEQFLATLSTALPDCSSEPTPFVHAQSAFPATSATAPEATIDPAGTDHSTAADRRVAWVTAETVLDVFWQQRRQQQQCPSFPCPGAGLRGGSTAWSPGNNGFTATYTGARFAADVAVTGTMTFTYDNATDTFSWTAPVTLTGPSGTTGTVTVSFTAGDQRTKIAGTINGHQVALLD